MSVPHGDGTAGHAPAFGRNLSFGNGKIVGTACFAQKQVVAVFALFVFQRVIADGKQAPFRIVKKGKIGSVNEHKHPFAQFFRFRIGTACKCIFQSDQRQNQIPAVHGGNIGVP